MSCSYAQHPSLLSLTRRACRNIPAAACNSHKVSNATSDALVSAQSAVMVELHRLNSVEPSRFTPNVHVPINAFRCAIPDTRYGPLAAPRFPMQGLQAIPWTQASPCPCYIVRAPSLQNRHDSNAVENKAPTAQLVLSSSRLEEKSSSTDSNDVLTSSLVVPVAVFPETARQWHRARHARSGRS